MQLIYPAAHALAEYTRCAPPAAFGAAGGCIAYEHLPHVHNPFSNS